MLKIFILEMGFKITNSKSQPHLWAANELSVSIVEDMSEWVTNAWTYNT